MLKGLLLKGYMGVEEINELHRISFYADPRFKSTEYESVPLPAGFTFIGAPNGQNCFMHCLDVVSNVGRFGVKEFKKELTVRQFKSFSFSHEKLKLGDIILYTVGMFLSRELRHAATYVGDNRVQSRWGFDSPLLEHPLDDVHPAYWNSNERNLSIARK